MAAGLEGNILQKGNDTMREQNKEKMQKKQKEPSGSRNQVHAGDQVIMTDKYPVPDEIKGLIWTVLTEPKYINGTRRVQLKDYKKRLYPADGLRVVG